MENLIQLERYIGFMNLKYDYKIELWVDIMYWAERVITAPLCLLGKHKYRVYNPKVDVCHRCNHYKIMKKRRAN